MTTRLEKLLDSIHPSRTIEAMDRRADDALNSFPMDVSKITEWESFRLRMTAFLLHVENVALRVRPRRPNAGGDAFHWGRCRQILIREYGPSGDKAAFEMARTGNDGGLYGVLKQTARRIAAQFAETEIRARIQQYWNALSVEEKTAAEDEYLRKYGHLLPSELTEGSAARIRVNLPDVLEEHPKLMARLGRIGRM